MSYRPLATYKPNRLLLLPDLILDWREPSLCPGDSELSSPRGSKISAVSSHSLSFVSPSRASLRRSDHARRPYESEVTTRPLKTSNPRAVSSNTQRAHKLSATNHPTGRSFVAETLKNMAVKSAVYDYSLYTPDYYLKGFEV